MKAGRGKLVYADWEGFEVPIHMGTLTAIPASGKEVFSFEYSREWLKSDNRYIIVPDIRLYVGKYFPRDEKPSFVVFLDSSPDR